LNRQSAGSRSGKTLMTTQNARHTESHTWNEILSQSNIWQAVLGESQEGSAVAKVLGVSNGKRGFLFIGCGTSFYLAEAAAISWTLLTGKPARAIAASEILLFPELVRAEGSGLQAIVISRSGRTSEAVRAANVLRQELRIPTAGITCNGETSDLEKACDVTIKLSVADEQSTVMTRSFTSMLLCLQALAAQHAGNAQFVKSLRSTATEFASRISALAEQVETFVTQHTFADYAFLGQGPFHGLAREAALKVMEMSCSYSQFFHALEFRHGPKAIVSPATCLTFLLSETGMDAETEVLEEMKQLGGVTVAICNRANAGIRRASNLVIELGLEAPELALLAPSIVPCQLLGYFTAMVKGLNPDRPKNLARVVILD
jgi:glutamine---fructose-6-phosphate transaminase (isomerizing)